MSWYSTKEEAEEACKEKEKMYNKPFKVLEEEVTLSGKEVVIYWAQRILDEK